MAPVYIICAMDHSESPAGGFISLGSFLFRCGVRWPLGFRPLQPLERSHNKPRPPQPPEEAEVDGIDRLIALKRRESFCLSKTSC